MNPAEVDALAEAVARKLSPMFAAPLRLTRRQMAAQLGISSRLLQELSNRQHDPCPCTRLNTVPLYDRQAVEAWLSHQKKTPTAATVSGKEKT